MLIRTLQSFGFIVFKLDVKEYGQLVCMKIVLGF